jgi:hypothetical protein
MSNTPVDVSLKETQMRSKMVGKKRTLPTLQLYNSKKNPKAEALDSKISDNL